MAHSAYALRRIASNTGVRLPRDELITSRMSAVAVCRSCAARSSLCRCAIPDREFAGVVFPDLGLLAFGVEVVAFESLRFDDFAFGIAALRLAVGRFVVF